VRELSQLVFTVNRLIPIWTVLIFVTVGAQGQAFTATWPLSNTSLLAGTAAPNGAVTVSDELVNAGISPGLVINSYNGFGQQVNQGSNAWDGVLDYTRYLEFTVSALPGEEMTLNQVEFEYGWDFSFGILILSEVWISPDGFSSIQQQLATTPLYQQQAMAQYSSTSVSGLPASSTWSVRIYPYSNQATGAKRPIYATHRNVVLSGTTQPDSPSGECLDPVPPGLVGWWPGDNNASDISGSGNHGTFTGPYVSPGKVADAFATGTGTASTVSVQDDASLNFGPGQGFTIDFWMRTDDPTGFYNVLSKQDLFTLQGYRVYLAGGMLFFEATAASGTTVSEPYPADSGWHFVGIVVSSGSQQSMTIMIDTAPSVPAPVALPTAGTMVNTSPLILGGWSPNPLSSPFVGELDEIEIFNRALQVSELQSIYDAGEKGKCKPEEPRTGTIEGTKFNDIDGNGFFDPGEDWGTRPAVLIEADDGTNVYSGLTDASGLYSITVPFGQYTVTEDVPAGFHQTFPTNSPPGYTVIVGPGGTSTGFDFGNQEDGLCIAPPADMVGWWSGDSHANDLSGNANHGTLQGSASYAAGEVAQAFDLPGIADFVEIPPAASLDFGAGQDFTIEAWINTTGSGQISIVDKRTLALDGSHSGYSLSIVNGQLAFQMGDGAAFANPFIATTAAINNGEWHFVGVTVKRASTLGISMYVDNNLVATFDPTSRAGALTNTSPLYIGRNAFGGGVGFGGQIDEVEIFNRALTELEMNSIFNAGPFGKCKPEEPRTGTIEGTKFSDLDGNGSQNGMDSGLANVTIELLLGSTSTVVDTEITDNAGNYTFTNVPPGSYTIQEIVPWGWHQTAPTGGTYTVNLAAGQVVSNRDFGNQPDDCNYICNTDFEEIDNVSDPTIFSWIDQDNVQCWSTTASDGRIEIWNGNAVGNPAAASGNLFAELNGTETATLFQTFWGTTGDVVVVTFAHMGRYDDPDEMEVRIGDANNGYVLLGTYSDTNASWTRYTETYTLLYTGFTELQFVSISSNGGAGPADGGNFIDEVGINCPSGICGIKFNDSSGDGAFQPGEEWSDTLPVFTFEAVSTNLTPQATAMAKTDDSGNFCFADLAPGTYTVGEVAQNNWIQTVPANPDTYTVTLGSEENLDGYYFGNQEGGLCIAPPADMVGWWSGDSHANDLSGNANHGTLRGSASYAAGEVAQAFDLPGIADFVEIPPAASLDFGAGQDFTIEAWAKTSANGLLNIVDKRTGSSSSVFGYSLFIFNGRLGFQMGDGQAALNHASTATLINDGEWHFVGVTVERGSTSGISMYIDNNPVETFNPTTRAGDLTNKSPLYIGKNALNDGVGFGGQIDEVEIFNRALIKPEMRSIYRAGPFGKCKDGPVNSERLPEEIPAEYALEVNYPNPFNPSTRIAYTLPEKGHVRLEVFNILGQPVRTLVDGIQPPGQYGVTFDAGGLPSGIYLYRMMAGSFSQTNKMLLLK
jgi:Concanavalin A-like lectin/glucanases superfamily/SdrD B-like domain